MKAYKVTATDVRAVLLDADDIYRTVYLNVVNNEAIAIGDETVTFATGLLVVKHSAPLALFVPPKQTLHCICDTGKTEDVRVLVPDVD